MYKTLKNLENCSNINKDYSKKRSRTVGKKKKKKVKEH